MPNLYSLHHLKLLNSNACIIIQKFQTRIITKILSFIRSPLVLDALQWRVLPDSFNSEQLPVLPCTCYGIVHLLRLIGN